MAKKNTLPQKTAEETTGQQSKNSSRFNLEISNVSSSTQRAGFPSNPQKSYDLYRKISSHPTVALVKSVVTSPIVGGSWVYNKRNDDVPDEYTDLIKRVFDPIRNDLVSRSLRALEMGWTPFEVVWKSTKCLGTSETIITKVKPLLQDITDPLVDEHGNLEGVVNRAANLPEPIVLDEYKYFVYTYDSVDGSPLGRSRHENIIREYIEAEEVRRKLAQYLSKVCGVTACIHYPLGTFNDASGAERPADFLARDIADALARGDTIILPNLFASTDDLELAKELSGASSWHIDFLDPGGTDFSDGIKDALAYYDQLFCRGWLRSERTCLEGEHGTKAEAQTHTDSGTMEAELIDRDLAHCISKSLVNYVLVLNFGEEARDSVYISAAPLEDDSVALYQSIVNKLLSNSETAKPISDKIDIDAMFDGMDVPTVQTRTIQGTKGDLDEDTEDKQDDTLNTVKEL